jgi:prepilin-type N-terminal cleavage/methylation domain-containing protein
MKLTFKSKLLSNTQQGYTLIELMISMLIGLIILAAVIGMFVSMVKSDNDYLKSIRLNQELRAAMSLITRDIRRSGANRNAAVNSATTPPTNPFAVAGTTKISIGNPGPSTGTSISFSYDEAADATTELYGYRLNSTAGTEGIESCTGETVAGCGTWRLVTDNSLVNITALSFTGATVTEGGINIRQITVTLSGRLRKDSNVARTLTETVKVRNDDF